MTSGQAIIEFVVALVAVIVLFAGLLQIGELTVAHTRTMTQARREAGQLALQEMWAITAPRHILNWERGNDKSTYSQDDLPVIGDPGAFIRRIVNYSDPDQLEAVLPGNEMSALSVSPMPDSEFRLVRGSDSTNVAFEYPAIGHLLYKADSVTVKSEVWMTWTKGIY